MNYNEAVQLAKNNDNRGFTFLYESTYKEKYYLALKYMKNEDDAMDVLQDSYIKAFNKIDMLEDAERFSPWLGMIVANTAKNALQKKKPVLFNDISNPNEDDDFIEYQIEDFDTSSQPELAYSEKETKELLAQMLNSLSEEQKMCLLLFHVEGLSIKDIAKSLDCSENTVKSRLNYGRKNLKIKAEELQKKGYKLYGISPVALLLLLLNRNYENFAQSSIPKPFENIPNSQTNTSPTKGISAKTISNAGKKAGFFSTVIGKVIAVVLSAAIVSGVVTAVVTNSKNNNSNKNNNISQSVQQPETTASQSTTTTTTTTQTTKKQIDVNQVLDAYQKYIETEEFYKPDYLSNEMGYDESTALYYEFGYLDDDDIPELFVIMHNSPTARGNICQALGYDGKKVTVQGGTELYYNSKGGIAYFGANPSGCVICEYKNGKFKEIGNGGFTWDEKNPYVWNDKSVTFEEYEAKIEKYIDTSKAKHPTGKYKTFSQARKNFNKK